MATSIERRALPYGVGRITPRWAIAVVALLALVGLGAYAYSRQVSEGEVVTGLRDLGPMAGTPWGLYIVFELWFVGIGFGSMMLLAVIRLLDITPLRPLTRALALIALATLFIGGWSVIADVGQPGRAMINIIRYARPMSPFFGTFTFGIVTAFTATVIYLYLDSRRDAAILSRLQTRWAGILRLISAGYTDTAEERQRRRNATTALGIALLVIGAVAASFSAFVFGFQQGRPGWFSSLQAPGFVALAALSGIAGIVIVASILRATMGEREKLNIRMFAWLSNLMMAMAIVYLYFVAVEILTSSYSARYNESRVTEAIVRGEYAWMFWLSTAALIVALVIGIIQAIARQHAIWLTVVAASLVLLAALAKRYLLIVPPLSEGRFLPYPDGSYSPTWVEYSVVVGLIALGVVAFLVFVKVFPIMDVEDDD